MIEYENLDLTKYQTPCYLIDRERFSNNLARIKGAFEEKWSGNVVLGYSIKTNNSKELLRLARSKGMLAEAVSGTEYRTAQECGYPEQNIIFNGPQKTKEQLITALQSEAIVNIDGLREIDYIESQVDELDLRGIRVGLRVNFNLEEVCPGETTAGDAVSRFGICVENGDFALAVSRLHAIGVRIRGLHMHYSSKSRSTKIFAALAGKAAKLAREYGLTDEISYIDIGGGFFMGLNEVPGRPSMEEYADAIVRKLSGTFDTQKVSLILEPGASLVATCVDYMTRVVDIKSVGDTTVVTMDGSMLDINPFMAHREPPHSWITCKKDDEVVSSQIVSGSTCMEMDRFFEMQSERRIAIGDVLVCACAGAYTMSFVNGFINNPPRIYEV